jgi:hypothetical protein
MTIVVDADRVLCAATYVYLAAAVYKRAREQWLETPDDHEYAEAFAVTMALLWPLIFLASAVRVTLLAIKEHRSGPPQT